MIELRVRVVPIRCNMARNTQQFQPKPRPGLFNGKSSVLEAQDDEPQADVRSEWEVKNKVLRMLSQQGVPVLPGVNLVNVSLPKGRP